MSSATEAEPRPGPGPGTNAIDGDLASIPDEGVRRRLIAAFDQLRENADYGLVFEKHRPESVVLYGQQVREDSYATLRTSPGADHAFRVVSVDTRHATVQPVDKYFRPAGKHLKKPVADLVPLARFGDPIYPGLVPTGEVLRGGDKPFHTVINGENFHALETLLYAYEGQVDAIYIDPPYNSGARDWKYNNDYVDREDRYRHSLWLSMMEKRLSLAMRLLNPADSVLVVTIDEKEFLRLGLLLEQIFKGARIQMVSIAISPSGAARDQAFRRSDEYAFFVQFGSSAPVALPLGPEWQGAKGTSTKTIRWNGLMRSGTDSTRASRESMFFPIFLDVKTGAWHSVGDPLPLGTPRQTVKAPPGTVAVWPIRRDGTEGRWQIGVASVRKWRAQGFVRAGKFNGSGTAISYLKSGEQKKAASGVFGEVTMSVASYLETASDAEGNNTLPTTQWSLVAHSAADHGSTLLRSFVGSRKFPFPKSLYAVEDTLRFFVKNKPDALILDFFSGSGTTAHAVMRLNRQDDGRRRTVMVTNNEVAVNEQVALRSRGLNPGDPKWEEWGICEYITKPRLEAAITGNTPSGEPIKGEYKFVDPFPMADGFEENARFFNLVYLDPEQVEAKQAFGAVADLLWMIGGAEGSIIDKESRSGWAMPTDAVYGILFRNRGRPAMAAALAERVAADRPPRRLFIVADSEDEFHRSITELGADPAVCSRLYRDYLQNFRTNAIDLQEQP